MKVLHILSSMDPVAGGVCQAVRTIIQGLNNTGTTSEVICLNDPTEPYIRNEKFKIHALGQGKSSWSFHDKLLPWLICNLHKYKVVIVHGLWQYQSYAVYRAISKMKINKPNVFVMPHGMLDPYFQRARGRKMKALRNWIVYNTVDSRLIGIADGLLFTCETELLLARTTFKNYKVKQEYVVGLGVENPPQRHAAMDKAFFDRAGIPKETSFILFLGRIHPKKGVLELIRAYNRWRELTKGDCASLVIAGPGLDSSFGRQVKDKAAVKGIYLLDMLSGDEKWGALYNAEAFVLSSHQENFGIAVVEALACGKPVIVSNQVNIWKEIAKDNAGLIADDNEDALLSQLKAWETMNTAARLTMANNAKSTYNNFFSVPMAASRIYESINVSNVQSSK